MRLTHTSDQGQDWYRAYALTLSVCLAMTALALLVWGFGIRSSTINGGIALGIAIGLFCSAFAMLTSRGALAALPYFLIGCGVFFGLGTFIATQIPESMYKISFTTDVQREMLAKVNAANIVAITIVVIFAAPFSLSVPRAQRSVDEPGLRDVIDRLMGLMPILLMISIPVVALMWATFPRPSNLIVHSLLKPLSGIPLFTVLLGGAVWGRLDGAQRAVVLVLVICLALHGLLGLRKLYTILPILSFSMGLWLNRPTRVAAGIIALGVALVYFNGFSDTVKFSRLHGSFDPFLNTPLDRASIIADTAGRLGDMASLSYRGVAAQRLTIAPFEAHFIALYDSGAPGDSLRNFFNVLVPRVIWPDKPIIAPGAEFDVTFRGYIAESSLAIGFIAEAYWNLGWIGVILISAMIGVQMGWLTRRWQLFCEHGLPYCGIFLFAPLVLQFSLWVETNIVGGYVGGVVKLMLFVAFVDYAARLYVSKRNSAKAQRLNWYLERPEA
ncbi:MAG: hypothetical protein AAGD13_07005 [Pseudomonadota bacterium]